MLSSHSSIKQLKIRQLKEKLRGLGKPHWGGVTTGFDDIDAQLTDSAHSSSAHSRSSAENEQPILKRGGVHHVAPKNLCDMPAALGFAVHLALRLAQDRFVLWAQTHRARSEWGEPYMPGLVQSGVSPQQFLSVFDTSPRDWLWVLEEAGACSDIGCLIGLSAQQELNFTATRRFSLAVEASATTMILLSPSPQQALATATQWEVAAHAKGQWQVMLKRRAGATVPPPRPWFISPLTILDQPPDVRSEATYNAPSVISMRP